MPRHLNLRIVIHNCLATCLLLKPFVSIILVLLDVSTAGKLSQKFKEFSHHVFFWIVESDMLGNGPSS